MIEHINELNNINFGEMYEPLFLSKEKRTETWIDWKSAFLQQEILLKNVSNNSILSQISHSSSKENKLEGVRTILDNIENNKHIRKKRQRN